MVLLLLFYREIYITFRFIFLTLSGFFGDVYRGTLNGHTEIALKKMSNSASDIEALKGEAEVLKSLKHENVVLFMGLFKKADDIYIVTGLKTKVFHLK